MSNLSSDPIQRSLSSLESRSLSLKEGHVSIDDKLPGLFGDGLIRRVKVQPGLELISTRLQLKRDLCLQVEVDQPLLSFGCLITGRMSLEGSHIGTTRVMQDGDGIDMWASGGAYVFKALRGTYHALSLELSQAFLAKTLTRSRAVELRAAKRAISRPDFPFRLNCTPLSAAARAAAFSLFTGSYEDPFYSLLLESCALTLLRERLLSLTPIPHRSSSPPQSDSRKHAESLEEARRLLEDSPDRSPRLSELASAVGLNEWSLKNGFRARFGLTIYDYLRTHRMKIADAMLCSGDFNVSDTAFAVGYKNPGRFAMAYRREFGVAPKTRQIHFRSAPLVASRPSETRM